MLGRDRSIMSPSQRSLRWPTLSPHLTPLWAASRLKFTQIRCRTSGNFIKLAQDGFGNGLHFHRVIANFMIQFGCPILQIPTADLREQVVHPTEIFRTSFWKTPSFRMNPVRSVWPIRESSNSVARSFSSTRSTPYLDWFNPQTPSKHPVFGKIIDGLDIVKSIEQTPCNQSRPIRPVKVNSSQRIWAKNHRPGRRTRCPGVTGDRHNHTLRTSTRRSDSLPMSGCRPASCACVAMQQGFTGTQATILAQVERPAETVVPFERRSQRPVTAQSFQAASRS